MTRTGRRPSIGHRVGVFALDAALLVAAVASVLALGLGWLVLPPLAVLVGLVAGASLRRRLARRRAEFD